MTTRNSAKQAGFTLPELLVGGALILVFVAIGLLMLRPANYDAERRNASRRLDLSVMMLAIADYKQFNGTLPPSITTAETQIGTNEEGFPTLCDDLVPTYLDDVMYDPKASVKTVNDKCSAVDQFFITGYTVQLDGGRVILRAPLAENGESIAIERWFPLF